MMILLMMCRQNLGFDRSAAVSALRESYNDVNAAAERLLSR